MLKTDFPHEPLLSSPISINPSHHPLSQPTTTKNSSSSQHNYYHGLNLNKRRPSGGSLLGQDPTSRFEILERLGYGSTGSIVYKARDLQEDKIIAIKKIPIGLLAAFPGEETTSEDVDYFVSWIVDHCIADEPVADIGEDDDILSHSSSNHALAQTPASPAIVPTCGEHDDNDVDVDSQQQPTVAADTKAAAGEGGGRPRSHSVGSTRSRSGSVGSLRQSSSSRRRVRTRPSRQLLEEERLGLERLVRCLGCHRTDTDLWLELEYCPAGSAADLIRLTGGALSENEIGWLMSQVLYAVAYLHARGHVHGDIKAANILLTLDGQVKLGGSGAIMNHKEGAGERKRRRRSLTMSEFPASWLAPETSATTTAAAASVPASPSTPSSPTAYQQQQQQSSIPPSPGATLQRSSSFADTVSGGGGQQGSNDIGSAGWSAGGGSSGGMPEATIEADIWALGVACIELCQGMPPQPQAPILSIATAVAVAKCSGCNGDNSRDVSSRTGTPVSDGSSDTMGEGESGGGKSTSSSSTSNGDGSPEGDRSYSIAMSASHPSMAISTSSPSFTSIYSPLMEDTGSSGFGGMTTSFNSTTRADSANGLGDLTSRMSPTFWGFVARCLTPEPAARPTVHDLLHDPFIVERKHTKDELLERIQAMQAFVDQCAALTLAEPLLPEKPSNRDAATHGQTTGNKNTVDEGKSGWGGVHRDLHNDDMEEQDGPRDLSDTTAGVYSRGETVMDSAHLHHGSIEALRDEDEIPHVFGVKKVQSNGDEDNDDDDDDFRDPFEQRIGPWRVNLMPSRVEGTYDASSYFDEAGLPIAPSNQRHDNPIEWKSQRISHPIVKQALMCERAGYFSFRHSRSPSLATIVETEEERALERERELERARERQRRELERARLKAAAAAVSVLSLNKATAATAMTSSATTMAMQSTTTTVTSMPIIVNKDELVDVDEQARKEEDDEDRRRKNRAESVAAAVAVAAAAAASSGSDSGSMTGSDGGNGGGNNNSVAAAAAAAAAAAMAAPATKISTLSQATTSTTLMPPNPIQRLRRQSQVERDDASRQAVKERMQMMQQQREREEQELQLREAHEVDVAEKVNATSADPQRSWSSEMAPCKKSDVTTTTAYTPSRSKQLHGVTRSTSRGSNMSGGGGVGRGFLRRPLSKVGDQGLVIQAAEGTGEATVGEDMHGKVERGLEPEDDSSPGKTKKKSKVKKKLKKLAKIFSLQWWKQLGRRRKSSHEIVGQTSDKRR
ncbi:Serine/threonine-protein kinase 4 [Actinomortierella wolfii]|nr:Serine/threonine-protein kinase 4 [Actinomortierella wolfii]